MCELFQHVNVVSFPINQIKKKKLSCFLRSFEF